MRQVIRTEEQLNSLPEESVVLDCCGDVMQMIRNGVWLGIGDYESSPVALPATLIYMPGDVG